MKLKMKNCELCYFDLYHYHKDITFPAYSYDSSIRIQLQIAQIYTYGHRFMYVEKGVR